jgi:hypothetical protein
LSVLLQINLEASLILRSPEVLMLEIEVNGPTEEEMHALVLKIEN